MSLGNLTNFEIIVLSVFLVLFLCLLYLIYSLVKILREISRQNTSKSHQFLDLAARLKDIETAILLVKRELEQKTDEVEKSRYKR